MTRAHVHSLRLLERVAGRVSGNACGVWMPTFTCQPRPTGTGSATVSIRQESRADASPANDATPLNSERVLKLNNTTVCQHCNTNTVTFFCFENMPGSSLWLLPPSDHPLGKVLPALIDKTSKQFGSPHRFLPHVTLTSEISPSTHGSDGQAWLDSLDLGVGENEVRVNFKHLDSEDYFFRKLYIKCQVDDGLKKLAKQCRRHVGGFSDEKKAEQWANESYMPHLSLM